MKLHVRVIGTPSIEIDSTPLHLPLKKAEAMVYYLAIEKRASREKLASLFWGTKDENAAYNNFRNALYLLKQHLPDGVVTSDRRFVSFSGASCDLEVIESIDCLNLPLPATLADELLAGFDIPECADFGNWLIIARRQFKVAVMEQLRRRVTASYDAEDEDCLESALETLVTLDPFDEDAMLELMELYVKRRGAARASTLFHDYRRRLSEELSLSPSERAEAHFKRLIVPKLCEPQVRHDDVEHFFTGRKEEQQSVLDRLLSEEKRTVVIAVDGEAGVGKTSFLHRILSVFDQGTHRTFESRSYEAGLDYPYSSWSHLVSQAASYGTEEALGARDVNFSLLAGVFPDLMSQRPVVYNADSVILSERTPIVLGCAVSRLVCHSAGHRRPVVILEDLHWFDTPSLQMLEVFIASLTVPATVLITTRPERSGFLKRALSRLEEKGTISYLHVPLNPFDRAETIAFCRHFLDERLIESKEEDYFYVETEGMPLLIAELIKMLKANSKARLSGGVMLARFGEISENQREFLRVLSVCTRGATIPLIAEVLGHSSAQVSVVAEGLLGKGLIEERQTVGTGIYLDFSHAKLKECIYETIPGFKVNEYHKKLADQLNKRYSPRKWDPALSSMLCYHYTKAGLLENVLNQHLREMIFDITLNHDLFPLVQDDVLHSCLHPYNDRADTEKKMNEMSRLLAHIRSTLREENQKEFFRMEASFHELSGGYFIGWGEYDKAKVLLNRALKISRQYEFNKIYIHALASMGHYYLQTDNAEALMRMAREMLNAARDEEREKYMGIALRYLGVAFQILGNYEKSEMVLRRSMAIFEEQALLGKNYTLSILAARCYMGENEHWQGHFSKAVEHFKTCIDSCEERKLFWGSSHFRAHLADVAFDLGDMDLMFEHIYRGVETFERCQGGRCGSILYSLKSIADAKQGRYDDAYRSLEIGERLSAPIRKRSWIAVHAMAKALLAQMLEEGALPPQFNAILKGSSKDYGAEAAQIYSEIPVPHRVALIKETFGL